MNIEVLQDAIRAFRREVIDSGFRRDLDDYESSLPASENNIVALREIATKILATLDVIYSGDLPDSLTDLLPETDPEPFTSRRYDEDLQDLSDDTEVEQQQFYARLLQFVNQLRAQIQANLSEVDSIDVFIAPYVTEDVRRVTEEGVAMLAIVFNELETISSMDQLTKTLLSWNRVLPIYHQLLKSESPADIEIVEVQNGSIDFIVNIDVDVALDLVELFKLGFEVFAAYLSYKKMIQPIIATYHGNKKLISQEEARESLLLENIGTAVKDRVRAQNREAKKKDKTIDGTAVPKKVEQVTNLVTSHIVRGNDVKLLALPDQTSGEEGEAEEDHVEALREKSLEARRALRQIPDEAQQKLLEAYGSVPDEDEV